MSTIEWPWAIILCRFNDRGDEPQPPQYYRDLFTENGTGGMCDYWAQVSFGTLDLTSSQVFGWFEMNHSSEELYRLTFPGDRGRLVQWGLDAAIANGVDLRPFRSFLVVHNFGIDHGAAGEGIIIAHNDPASCEYGFICHEMGHGFGLPHSFSANPDWEYGDGWDLMSFATTTFQFPIDFNGTRGLATVGLNARNLEALNAAPRGRTWRPAGIDFSEAVRLQPLNQPAIGNRGHLIATLARGPAWFRVPPYYLVEFRHKAGWDQGIPKDAVLIHEVRANGWSYLQPTSGSTFGPGDQFVTPEPRVFVRVVGIDASPAASLRIWDVPHGSLRKEDSKPKVYLIDNGTKRWIPSPETLTLLGRSWDDVRSVPDGGLSSIPDGPDVGQFQSLGAQAASAPGAVLQTGGRLVVFTRGTDNTIWHRWQVTRNGDWSNWESVGAPPGGATSGPDAALNDPGGLVVFARGADNAIWHAWQDHPDGNWSGWESLGGEATSDPGAVLQTGGRLVVFTRGTDNTIWHRWQVTRNGDWSNWESVGAPPGGATSGPDAALNDPGGLVVFARGADNAIWHAWQDHPDGNWAR